MKFRQWIEGQETIACGDCFRFANKLIRDMVEDDILPQDKIFVCHGKVQRPLSPNTSRYDHAWVETPDRVHDWQLRMSGKGSLPLKDFYELFKPSDVKKYTTEEVMVNQARHRHHGPWE